jgi:hypothetical protein
MEEVIMSVVRDVLAALGDTLRLSGDLMRCRVRAEARIIKRVVSRLTTYLTIFLTSVILGGIGVGFILYGIFVLLARAIDSAGAAGLILGFVLLLAAIVTAVVGRHVLHRS